MAGPSLEKQSSKGGVCVALFKDKLNTDELEFKER